MPKPKQVGKIAHYFDKLGVAIVDLTAPLKVGDAVTFSHGQDTFEQTISSIQLDHEDIDRATKGKSVGVKVDHKVKEGTIVSKAA